MNREEAKRVLKKNAPLVIKSHIDKIIDFIYDHDLVVVGVFDYDKKHKEKFGAH